MKKLTISLFVLFIVISFYSCSKDNSVNSVNPPENIPDTVYYKDSIQLFKFLDSGFVGFSADYLFVHENTKCTSLNISFKIKTDTETTLIPDFRRQVSFTVFNDTNLMIQPTFFKFQRNGNYYIDSSYNFNFDVPGNIKINLYASLDINWYNFTYPKFIKVKDICLKRNK
jgi:hypothetical protein